MMPTYFGVLSVTGLPLFSHCLRSLTFSSLVSLVSVFSVSGCGSIIVPEPDPVEFPAPFFNSELPPPPVEWWIAFEDDQLNQYVDIALSKNYSLKAAEARLAQSQALLQGARSDYYPEVNAELEKSRRRASDGTVVDAWSTGVFANYELDLWGRIRAGAAQSLFAVDASSAAYRTLANTVAGEITTYWLGLRVQSERLRLLANQKHRLETALRVIEGRKRRGQAALTDVWQQQKLVESLSVDIYEAEAQRDIYLQQLALWSGATQIPIDAASVNQLTPITQSVITHNGVSLLALRSRPDVQQAFFELQASSAQVAVAVANRFPRLSLSASYSGNDSDLSSLFGNWVSNLGASLFLPLIDGSQRRSEVERQQASQQEALANYTQTLLTAAQEVQQALVTEQRYLRTLKSLSDQLDLARKTLKLQDYYYAHGRIDFLDLLNAQQELLSLESQHLAARWNLAQARIQLFKSVSHGRFTDRQSGENSLEDDDS